jgi:hypothetical protein
LAENRAGKLVGIRTRFKPDFLAITQNNLEKFPTSTIMANFTVAQLPW